MYVFRGPDSGEKNENPRQNDLFPIKVGPFDIEGHKNCVYSGPGYDTVGHVMCNAFEIKCVAVSNIADAKVECDSGNEASERIACTY